MKPLLADNDKDILPALYSTENDSDPMMQVMVQNFYRPQMFYLLSELDPETNTAFGYADLGYGEGELGYIDINEIEGIEHRFAVFSVYRAYSPEPLSKAVVQAYKIIRRQLNGEY
jgi:hypothetical protein